MLAESVQLQYYRTVLVNGPDETENQSLRASLGHCKSSGPADFVGQWRFGFRMAQTQGLG